MAWVREVVNQLDEALGPLDRVLVDAWEDVEPSGGDEALRKGVLFDPAITRILKSIGDHKDQIDKLVTNLEEEIDG